MILFDTHSHLDDEQFDDQRDLIVDRAHQAGVRRLIAVGTTADSSQRCVDIAEKYKDVYSAVGIQPNYCAEAAEDDWSRIEALCDNANVVAIGETGLDRYWDYTPLTVQEDYFDRHIKLSQKTGLPFIVHMRDSGDEILAMLRTAQDRNPLRGVMHSFTGNIALAQEFLDLGLYISFAGMLTFKKSEDLRKVAATIPGDRVLLETDSPYLSPHPKRGQRPNEPALLIHTAQCLADVSGVDLETIASQTTANAKRLFSVTD